MEEVLTGLLSTVASGKRHWGRAPAGTAAPYVVMNRIDGIPDYTMQGPSRLVSTRVQVDVYAATYTAARILGRQVATILSGYKNGSIQGVFLDGQRDLPAEDAGAVAVLFRVSLDFIIHHLEN